MYGKSISFYLKKEEHREMGGFPLPRAAVLQGTTAQLSLTEKNPQVDQTSNASLGQLKQKKH